MKKLAFADCQGEFRTLNQLRIQFLCIITANYLPIICQSASSFYYIGHIVAIATNYSNLLYQCFTNRYQSDPSALHNQFTNDYQ